MLISWIFSIWICRRTRSIRISSSITRNRWNYFTRGKIRFWRNTIKVWSTSVLLTSIITQISVQMSWSTFRSWKARMDCSI